MDLGKRIERRLKRGIFGLLARRADGRREGAAADLGTVRRVLLVRPNVRLGNLLLITPGIAALRQAFPGARIDVLCNAEYGCLLADDPAVTDVVPISRRTMRSPLALARLVRRLRHTRYDLVIECARGGSFLGAVLAWLSGGRLRAASAGGRYGRFFNVQVPRGRRTHKVDLLLELLSGLGVPPAGSDLRVVLTETERAVAAQRWRAWGMPADAPVIGVNLGGRGRKQWPVERFMELTRQLLLITGAHVALFGGPEEQSVRARVARETLPREAVVVPVLPVREFAALLAGCSVVVTADTGPMHLAAAVGTPTVVIARTPASAAYAPRTGGHRMVDAADESSVARVLAAVTDALRTRPKPPAA
jgi:ADP-heptose:LPS heptosyltransferase